VTTLSYIFSAYIYSHAYDSVRCAGGLVVTSTVVLNGQVIIEGVKFLWWVTDGLPARVTVSHPVHGTKTQTAQNDPEQQARALARGMLASAPPPVARAHSPPVDESSP
jgi:hypothetical protein